MKKISKSEEKKIVRDSIKLLKCDTARISHLDSMFLIIGFKRNTKDTGTSWYDENGKKIDFNYTYEMAVASGKNKEELLESIKHYHKLCNIHKWSYKL